MGLDLSAHEEIEGAIDALVDEGLIEVAGERDGSPVYVVTDKGREVLAEVSG